MGFVPLIEVTRGHLAECQHWGVVEVMDQLGWLDAAQQEALAPRRNAVIRNAKGLVVGAAGLSFACSAQQLEPGWHMRGYCRKCRRVSPSRIGQEYVSK